MKSKVKFKQLPGCFGTFISDDEFTCRTIKCSASIKKNCKEQTEKNKWRGLS